MAKVQAGDTAEATRVKPNDLVTPELLAAVIVTLTRPPPSLYWERRLWAGVRLGGWVGSAPGLKAGERAAERGFWGVGGAATGGSRAQREGPKS